MGDLPVPRISPPGNFMKVLRGRSAPQKLHDPKIYGHPFAQDRTAILDALNQAVSRLHAYETDEPHTRGATDAVA